LKRFDGAAEIGLQVALSLEVTYDNLRNVPYGLPRCLQESAEETLLSLPGHNGIRSALLL
jgi:hypothetical protein